jgi:hypothetical protein
MSINSSVVDEQHEMRAIRPWPTRLGPAADILFSVLIFSVVFLCLKVSLTVVRTVGDALWRVGSVRRLERRPILTAALSAISALVLVSPIGATIVRDMYGGQLLRIATFIVLLAFLLRCGLIALAPPSSLAEIRDQLQVEPVARWFAVRMRNPLDGVWLRPLLVLSLLVAPAVTGILLPTLCNTFTVILYGMVLAIGGDRINAFEHASSHYHFFGNSRLRGRTERIVFRVVGAYSAYLFPLLFAQAPHWYKVQHIVVHHAENNGEEDTQSTLRYDRASFIDLARCANRFAFSGLFPIDIVFYLRRKRRRSALLTLLGGMLIFYGTLGLVAFWNWQFVLIVVAFRYAGHLTTATTFFQEHGMVDISVPQNIYRNSLHYFAPDNTHGSLGDDMHIEHHLHQARHWSKYASDAQEYAWRYAAEGALGFRDGPHSLSDYYRMIWCRDFVGLAPLLIAFGRPDATTEEVAELLRLRTRPLGVAERSATLERVDCILGKAAGLLLLP